MNEELKQQTEQNQVAEATTNEVTAEVTTEQTESVKEVSAEAQGNVTDNTEEIEQYKSRITELETKLSDAIKIGDKAVALAESVDTLNADLTKRDAVIDEYKEILNTIVENKVDAIPEQYRDLVPANMGLKEKLEWLDKAEKSGLFGGKVSNPQVEVGKPMNVENPQVDATKLSASDKLRMAFATITK